MDITRPYSIETRKIILAQKTEGEPVSNRILATGMRNIMAFGFLPSLELTEAMSQLSKEDFVAAYENCISLAKEITDSVMGDARIFYSGFPDTVLEKTDAEMFVDQLISYLSTAFTGKDLPPEDRAVDRDPLFEKFDREPNTFNLGSVEDMNKFYEARIWSNNSLSGSKLEETLEFMKQTKGWKSRLNKEMIPNKENASIFASKIEEIEPNKKARLHILDKMLPTTTDVLRFAALTSNGRSYTKHEKQKYKAYVWGDKKYRDGQYVWRTRKVSYDTTINNKSDLSGKVVFRLSSSEAHTVKTLLANKPSLYEDLWTRKELFKNLAKSISMKNKTPDRLRKAYDRLCANERINERGALIKTAFGRVEAAITAYKEKGDMNSLEKAAKSFPGIFSRNYLRLADITLGMYDKDDAKGRKEGLEMLAGVYERNCGSVPIREQLKLMNVATNQPDKEERYIYESKILKYVSTPVSEIRKSLTAEERGILTHGIISSMRSALENEPSLGKVYVAPETTTLLLPENGERASSKNSVLTSGSRIKLNEETNIVRPFIWWTNLKDGNYEERVDLDLSATFMDENMKPIGDCSYCNQRLHDKNGYGFIAISSGDRTDGGSFDGKGVGEFLDIDKAACERNGIRYVSFSVHGFTRQNFDKMAHAKFGFMQREGYISCPRDAEEHGVNPDSIVNMANREAEKLRRQHVFDTGNGEAYEPSTVDFCCDLNYPATQETTALLDVEKEEFIWVDKPMQFARGLQNSVNEKFVSDVVAQTHKLLEPDTPSIGMLFATHAMMRGTVTDNIKEADLVVLPKPMDEKELGIKEGARVITAYDIGTISSEFMKAFGKGKDKNEQSKDIGDLEEDYGVSIDMPEIEVPDPETKADKMAVEIYEHLKKAADKLCVGPIGDKYFGCDIADITEALGSPEGTAAILDKLYGIDGMFGGMNPMYLQITDAAQWEDYLKTEGFIEEYKRGDGDRYEAEEEGDIEQ